ncbi:hypothetical protein [Sinomonas sp. ASV322]|uniref:hypothetical protein n=1 Tax=Sinomonas sp. ASV322 TaxID=3041920 RepID=UPI0027DB2153|nr:hypothetical protein [Sinomonas sp. ASV322]MDQ4504447.1 hypothetical protein [Sinomonas sp. ASV322]
METALGITVLVVLTGLGGWWVLRTWHGFEDVSVSDRLRSTGLKAFVVAMAFAVAGSLFTGGATSGAFRMLLDACGWALAVCALCFVAGGIAARVERAAEEARERRGGVPTAPRLWPAWGVAVFVGVLGFFGLFAGLVGAVFVLAALQIPQVAYSQSMEQGVRWAGGIYLGLIALFWAVQKYTLWRAWTEYEQLTAGIEHRLAEQRRSLLADAEGEA